MSSLFLAVVLCCLLFCVHCELYDSSCIGKEDGTYALKLMDGDDYPLVKVKCSNEYAILDYNYDNNIQSYFKSWEQWHINVYGPSNADVVNWENWYLPDDPSDNEDSTHSYLLSPDCSSCDSTSKIQLYDEKTTYWMTGTLFGCFWRIKGAHNCDVDWDTYSCYSCSSGVATLTPVELSTTDESLAGSTSDWDWTGICPVNVRSSSYELATSHYECTTYNSLSNLKPSIGFNGEYCVCAKPSENNQYESDEIISLESEDDSDNDDEEIIESVVVSLYQKDFEKGTYRITTPGTYTIMEDIVFNFNPGDMNDPQANDAWWPKSSQVDDYPGAGEYKDAYFMGFFAGITIETSDVVLNLNGYELSMDEIFYYQQRWFVGIELTGQYFLPGQGFGNFGADPQIATNVIIKNGVIGLSSHHGIHGNNNKNIQLLNLVVKDFETHGIQFNGFDNIKLSNIRVGMTSNKVYFTGEYAHMRALLPRLRKIAEESGDNTIKFYDRDNSVTMSEIIEEIEYKMNLVFNYVVNNVEPDNPDTNKDWIDAKKLFYNEKGIPNGAAQYGIFLNTFGASVFTYDLDTNYYSSNAILDKIYIHDMQHSMTEKIALRQGGEINFFVNGVVAPFDVEQLIDTSLYDLTDTDDINNIKYKGSIITDAFIAMEYFSTNWNYLGAAVVGDNLQTFALEGDDSGLGTKALKNLLDISCNYDVMIHSGKGIGGLRLDGVESVTISDLEVYNLMDTTPIGNTQCGDYSTADDGGHFRQTQPMQNGFTGNRVQAIVLNSAKDITFKDISVHDLQSHTGTIYGMAIWPNNEITLNGNIQMYNLKAGTQISSNTYNSLSRPNRIPEVCGIYKEQGDDYADGIVITADSVSYDLHDFEGHTGCSTSSSVSHYGIYKGTMMFVSDLDVDVDNEDNNDDISISFEKKLKNEFEKPEKKLKRYAKKSREDTQTMIWVIIFIVAVGIMSLLGVYNCYYSKLKNNDDYEFNRLPNTAYGSTF